jgi:hypothetical protein
MGPLELAGHGWLLPAEAVSKRSALGWWRDPCSSRGGDRALFAAGCGCGSLGLGPPEPWLSRYGCRSVPPELE